MPNVTIISDDTRTVDASVSAGRILLDSDRLPDALGWELKPEGLCRGDSCVPVRDRAALFVGEQLDLAQVAHALGRPAVIDAEAGLAVVALPSEQRRRALDDLVAPAFTLDDLDGNPHTLDEWRGKKKLLVAFASW